MSGVGKVAVIGSGSVGLYYGGKLAASGIDVHFLLRSGSMKRASAAYPSLASKAKMFISIGRRYSATFVKSAAATLSSWR